MCVCIYTYIYYLDTYWMECVDVLKVYHIEGTTKSYVYCVIVSLVCEQ